MTARFQGWALAGAQKPPNELTIHATECDDPELAASTPAAEQEWAADGSRRQLVRVAVLTPDGAEHVVHLTRPQLARTVSAALNALGDTFDGRTVGSLRPAEAMQLLLVLEDVDSMLGDVRTEVAVELAKASGLMPEKPGGHGFGW